MIRPYQGRPGDLLAVLLAIPFYSFCYSTFYSVCYCKLCTNRVSWLLLRKCHGSLHQDPPKYNHQSHVVVSDRPSNAADHHREVLPSLAVHRSSSNSSRSRAYASSV